MNKVSLYKVFECAIDRVESSGGDGFGIITFLDMPIREVAAAFEEWQQTHTTLYVRDDRPDDTIMFYHDQECLSLTSSSSREGYQGGMDIDMTVRGP